MTLWKNYNLLRNSTSVNFSMKIEEMNEIPITEQSNIITQNIDKANAKEIVKQLYKCDLEIFTGWDSWKSHQNILSPDILKTLHEVSTLAAEYIKPDTQNAGIILSGCGTSGRIAFLISRAFNEFALKQKLQPCYGYIISGGDHALMTSVESCEDDWVAGKRELERVAKGLEKVLYIGITCGLSAPFVGGQVEYCLQHLQRFTPYLLGFNPATQARNVPISDTKKVMKNIALNMEARGCLLNPIVGPEPITGSSRMKGGTATKMLLEAMFLAAHQLASDESPPIPYSTINTYKRTLNMTHTKAREISSLIEMAGNSLIKGGTVSYLSWGSLGIMGMIDAAECVPTFGANHDDVRCFLESGYEFLGNSQGDLSSQGDALGISFEYFIEKRCPRLSENDTVIFMIGNLSSEEKIVFSRIANSVTSRKVNIALVAINTTNDKKLLQYILHNPLTVHIVLPNSALPHTSYSKFLDNATAEVSLKWVINAVSTGAHIMKGKVLKNFMIDLKLTNGKLFERGVRIVASFGKTSRETAKQCLLRSIYRQDELSSSLLEADISTHVQKAGLVEKVIPLALLLTKEGFDVDSGLKMLNDCPIVRQCIDNAI